MDIIKWLSDLVSKLADWLGKRKREELMRKHPDGLVGEVSEVLLTRGKKPGTFINPKEKGYFSTEELVKKYPRVYEVVYHCKLPPHEDFVLSLFEQHKDDNLKGQLLKYVGKKIRITKFGCVVYPLHRLIIGSDVEVYIQEAVIIS